MTGSGDATTLATLATTAETVVQQIGGICVALITAGLTYAGLRLSHGKQRGPKLYEMDHDEAIELIVKLESENTRLRAERNAWRDIAVGHGWDRRTESDD